MLKLPKIYCAGMIRFASSRRDCMATGKLEHDGKLYCGKHHPPSVEARAKRRRK